MVGPQSVPEPLKMPFPHASEALSRFTVLDLTRVRSGPTCVRQLADWGANVVKIDALTEDAGGEQPGGPRRGSDFQNLHRNKRAMTLNLKDARGLAVFKRLAAKADVVVENFRPDVKKKLGIDYESIAAINPRIVYGSISGFGQDGPYHKRPGFDQIAQGMGGLMSITGAPGEGPMRVGIPVADLTAGLFCAQGILTALLEREVSGKGQWVQTSLLQAQIFMLDFQAARWLMEKEVAKQAGNNHPTSIPTGVFRTSDGYINIATTGGRIWERCAQAIGAPELYSHPDYATAPARSKNRDALNAEIEKRTLTKSTDSWVRELNEAGVPCGPIYAIDQMFEDAQVKHLGIAQDVPNDEDRHIRLVGQPVTLSRTPSKMVARPPDFGEQTEEVLKEFGLSADEIVQLRDAKVV
uniref:CoA transferase n=2 Tax=Bradyrhizobium amphicarpaeae TaxID=1404768 RepID=A0A2U8PXP0_9BRAD|nr:CoA transferase [Bradyrhizobium amphicarpaeae]